jgi:hypothetical protein
MNSPSFDVHPKAPDFGGLLNLLAEEFFLYLLSHISADTDEIRSVFAQDPLHPMIKTPLMRKTNANRI